MGREGCFPRYHPDFPHTRHLRLAGLFALTFISLSANVENTVRTTCGAGYPFGVLWNPAHRVHTDGSRGNFDWFRLSAGFSPSLAPLLQPLPVYFPLSLPFYWGRLLRFIICGIKMMSRLGHTSTGGAGSVGKGGVNPPP